MVIESVRRVTTHVNVESTWAGLHKLPDHGGEQIIAMQKRCFATWVVGDAYEDTNCMPC